MARICVVTQDLGLGGGEFRKLEAFLRFAELRDHVCDIYYPAEGPYPEVQVNCLRQVSSVGRLRAVPVFDKVPHFVRAASFGRHCKFVCRYDAYQLISTPLNLGLPFIRHDRQFVAWMGCTYNAEVGGIPRTKLRHYYLYNRLTKYISWRQEVRCASGAVVVLAVSRYTGVAVQSELHVPPHKVRILPVPVDTRRFVPVGASNHHQRYILSVARLDRRKDFTTLLRAFRLVVDRLKSIELRIVGGGPERENLERVSRELGLERNVAFLGHVPEDELVSQYQGATLFALSSRQEGLGIVFLEAMACALPVIATDCGGSADPVVHGKTGFLVPVGDWRQLAEKIVHVLHDRPVQEQLGRAGRLKAEAEYSLDVIYRELDSVYQEAFGVIPPLREGGPDDG